MIKMDEMLKTNPIPDIKLEISSNKKIYFASDQHFSAEKDLESSLNREKHFVQWLIQIEKDASCLFLMGDLFDFWHEWKFVIPKGFVRVLGKLAELRDNGKEIYFFTGNHDIWMKDYFQNQLNIPVFHSKKIISINNKILFLAHGDGLGPGDTGYKRMKKLFTNPLAQFAFRWIHPDISFRFADYLSKKNKLISGKEDVHFLGEDKEYLLLYSEKKASLYNIDYFIYGHRHLPLMRDLKNGGKYINLGDWISYFSYAEMDHTGEIKLSYFPLK